MMTTAFVTHPDCLLHDMGAHHPESPRRLRAIEDGLKEAGIHDFLRLYEAPLATRARIELVHSAAYVDFLHTCLPPQGLRRLDADTAMNPHSLKAAYRAAGAVIKAVDLLIAGEADNAFCNVRPPGHHAESNQAMGFCLFNNIAIGAAYALTRDSINKVAIIDFDVHHGNGTEEIFQNNENVLICSSFQHPNYPGKDFIKNSDRVINVTLAPGSSARQFREAVEQSWFARIESFKPEMIFISAGFDAHMDDPLAELNLSESDYAWLTQQLVRMARKYAASRIVSSLEGGYSLPALGRCATAHIRALIGI